MLPGEHHVLRCLLDCPSLSCCELRAREAVVDIDGQQPGTSSTMHIDNPAPHFEDVRLDDASGDNRFAVERPDLTVDDGVGIKAGDPQSTIRWMMGWKGKERLAWLAVLVELPWCRAASPSSVEHSVDSLTKERAEVDQRPIVLVEPDTPPFLAGPQRCFGDIPPERSGSDRVTLTNPIDKSGADGGERSTVSGDAPSSERHQIPSERLPACGLDDQRTSRRGERGHMLRLT
jgi:hypothetical protein